MKRNVQDIIDDMRNIVKPNIAKMLLEANYEGCGKEDKADFETEFEMILTLAETGLKFSQIPEDATNGEVLEKIFPMSEIIFDGLQEGYINFCMISNSETMNCISKEWWYAPYKAESEAAEQ